MKLKSNKGLTLIELVVSMALLTIIVVGSLSLLDFGGKSFKSGSKAGDLQSRAANITAEISQEVRKCSSISVDPGEEAVTLVYHDGTTASIYKEENKLMLSSGGQLDELASGISSIKFTGLEINGRIEGIFMSISLMEDNEDFTFSTSMFRRS